MITMEICKLLGIHLVFNNIQVSHFYGVHLPFNILPAIVTFIAYLSQWQQIATFDGCQ